MELENIGVKYEDEDKALVLLYSLSRSYETLVDILQHGRDTISLEDVVSALKAKEHKWKSDVGERTAAIVENDDSYETADVLVASTSHSDKWIMDSRCSYHITSNGDWFADYKEINEGQVLLGNNSLCKVIGIGLVRIKTHDGFERILPDVRHVPKLKQNLISLGMLDQHGFCWKGEKGFLKVSKGLLVVMKGVKDMTLYLLQRSTMIGIAAMVMESGKNSLASL
ncbi:hypothetical protein UlMin_012869 [Ulmus minor]